MNEENQDTLGEVLKNYLVQTARREGDSVSGQCLAESDILRYIEGKLAADRVAEIEKHIRKCNHCLRDFVLFSHVYLGDDDYSHIPDEHINKAVKKLYKEIVFQKITRLTATFQWAAGKLKVAETEGEVIPPVKYSGEYRVVVYWEVDGIKLGLKVIPTEKHVFKLKLGLRKGKIFIGKAAINIKNQQKEKVYGPFKSSKSAATYIPDVKPGDYTLEIWTDKLYSIQLILPSRRSASHR